MLRNYETPGIGFQGKNARRPSTKTVQARPQRGLNVRCGELLREYWRVN
jgi:hypothetical protein